MSNPFANGPSQSRASPQSGNSSADSRRHRLSSRSDRYVECDFIMPEQSETTTSTPWSRRSSLSGYRSPFAGIAVAAADEDPGNNVSWSGTVTPTSTRYPHTRAQSSLSVPPATFLPPSAAFTRPLLSSRVSSFTEGALPYDRLLYGRSYSEYAISTAPTLVRGRNEKLEDTPDGRFICGLDPDRLITRGKLGSDDVFDFVEKLHDRDDIDHMPKWKRRLNKLTPLFSLLAIVAYWFYLAFRIHFTVDAQRVANKTFYMAWVFITVEIGVATPMMLHQFWQVFLFKGRNRPKYRLRGDTVPTVDVFVTCAGEDVDVVLDTTRAACALDYPSHRFRVVVLDDKADKELKEAIDGLKRTYPNVYYTARTKIPGVPHHAKAGNLNHGVDFVRHLPDGEGKYIAALDADMIPEPDWLRALMGHMVLEPKLAMACPPQQFYNVPENDPLLQSLDSFVHISEPVKDAVGVAWCTGSGYVVRRCALEEIGLFPYGSLAEDVCFSSMLLGRGWKTAYIHEPLQWGTVPDSFTGHLKQRTRWTIGTLQTQQKLNFCLWGKDIRRMTVMQRLSGVVYGISSLFTIFLTASLLTMPIVLVSGGTLVAYASYDQLRWLIRLCFVALFCSRLNEYVMYLPAGYRLGQREAGAMMWMAPYHAMTIVRSFILPKWLGGKLMAFSSSGSISSELNERDARLRAPLARRLKVILWDCKAIMHVLYILFCITAVTLSVARALVEEKTRDGLLINLLTHAAYPPLLWLVCLVACWAPIHYAIWPPTMPDREALLDRNQKTGVAYPTPEAKAAKWGRANVLHEIQYTLLTAFTTTVFFLSLFF